MLVAVGELALSCHLIVGVQIVGVSGLTHQLKNVTKNRKICAVLNSTMAALILALALLAPAYALGAAAPPPPPCNPELYAAQFPVEPLVCMKV